MTSQRFHEKNIVITGAASGIGAACARAFAKEGATLLLVDRDAVRLGNIADELAAASFVADVKDEQSIIAMADYAKEKLGILHAVVTSAGIVQPPYKPEDMPMELFDDVVAINFRGTFLTLRALMKLMKPGAGGSMVTISSITAERSVPLHVYAPQKAAITNLTMGLAAEWGPKNIRVNAIEPGYTRTPALQEQIDKGHRDETLLAKNSTLGRMVEPHEIADAVMFLCSDQASAITGIALPVDAGFLCAGSWGPYGGLRG